ncbi:MAG: pilus assembly protein [Wenzhouxiangella sp.]
MKNKLLVFLFIAANGFTAASATQLNIAQEPLFIGQSVPPHVMINMSVDSQLFFSAFPEFADLSGDGRPDRGYVHEVDYFGYFDPFKCYTYSTTDGRFVPVSETADKFCPGANWSGNFLNWVTMARIDTVRAILYGGKRRIDTPELTVLERTHLPNDAHSWVKHYDGPDLNLLTPHSVAPETVGISRSSLMWVTHPENSTAAQRRTNAGFQRSFAVPGWVAADAQLGDQLEILLLDDDGEPLFWLDEDEELRPFRMRGVIFARGTTGGNTRVDVQVTSSEALEGWEGTFDNWRLINHSRRGVSFCNTTVATGASHGAAAIAAPPLMRVARGDYSLWTANERWQCRWENERSRTSGISIGGQTFSNANDVSASRLWANSENPIRNVVGLGNVDYNVFVEVCREGLIGTERCRAYGPDETLKPIGLLQEFGADGRLRFGLMTGSFSRHVSGGVLRKNMGTFGDEVNLQTGQFLNPADSIVRSLDALRIFGYNHGTGEYTADAENCVFGTSKAQMVNGRCFSWGNPQAEIFAESLRYLAGLDANPTFAQIGVNDRLTGLTAAEWNNPIEEALWCTPKTVIQFNASVTSFDNNAAAAAADLPGLGNLNTWTNLVGSGEGLAGAEVFMGGSTGFCTAEEIGNLADFAGICPEAPNQDGTYHIAGLAHFAHTNDLRPTWPGEQTVRTIGVSLAPAVPRIDIPLPGETQPSLVILPACDNAGDNLRCALAEFRIIEQDLDKGTGAFFVQWDVAEWGADFDSDLNGTLSYEIRDSEIFVTTEVWAQSSGRRTGFGYIISGTNNDGFHAHSGINSYSRVNPGADVPNCVNCIVGAAPTTAKFEIGGGAARLLREPLFYAAKWGGFDRNGDFPSDPLSWDSTGDGLPDNYFFAVDPAELFVSLRRAFQQVLDAIETTTLETTSSRLETGTLVYQAGFDTSDWSGNVVAIDPLAPGGSVERWNATDVLSSAGPIGRNIVTPVGTGRFEASNQDLVDALFAGVEVLSDPAVADCGGLDADRWFCRVAADDLVNFLRGDKSLAESNPNGLGFLRDRSSMVGNIVNSQIILNPVAGAVNEGWSRLISQGGQAAVAGGAYAAFVESKLDRVEQNRSTVFVGSNNGMLHAFNATNGAESFAFVPSAVVPNMYALADPNYLHRFSVDGRVSVADAFVDGQWRTILVGGLGAGGKGLYALDVTNPESFSENDILWELTPASLGAENIGHIFGAPTITRLSDGTFVTIVGNGYNSRDNRPSLMVIRLSDGFVLDELAPMGEIENVANGLSAPSLVLDGATRTAVSRVYAGDLTGRLWSFDFNDGPGDPIDSAREVFRAQIDGVDQPITAAPNVATSVEGGLNVFFGTGRFFVVGDNQDTAPTQTFYRIRDVGTNGAPLARADLGRARILAESPNGAREVVAVDFSANGWFLDLIGQNESAEVPRERFLNRPEISAGRVLFSTFQPSDQPCDGGGLPRLYVLDADSGGGVLRIPGLPPGAAGGGILIPDVGAPLNPPVVISPPAPTPPGDFDPFNPVDEDGNPIIIPDGADFDRSTWCSEVGFLSPIGQQFIPLAALCDGRQIWRQIW